MTIHPDREVLLAYADGELPDHEAGDVGRHVAGCGRCDAAISELRAGAVLFAGALRTLDADEPAAWALPWELETGRDEAVLPLRPRRAVRRRSVRRAGGMMRWAAGILLVTSATAAAAIVGVRVLSPDDPVATTSRPQVVEPDVAAVVVRPEDGRLRIAVTGAGAEARLFIAFEDRSTASVAVEGGAAPRFRTVDGRVDLDLRGASAVLRLTLPRTLREAIVTADGVAQATVEGERVLPADAASGSGVLLASSGRPQRE